MNTTQRNGVSFIGALFLGLGAFKFFTGGNWIVWVILGILFGGLGLFARKRSAS